MPKRGIAQARKQLLEAAVWIAVIAVSFAAGFFVVKAWQNSQPPTPVQQQGPAGLELGGDGDPELVN
jgi:hypothetical protein